MIDLEDRQHLARDRQTAHTAGARPTCAGETVGIDLRTLQRWKAHRRRAKAPKGSRPPTTHIATAARQAWCWDLTFLPALVLGRWFYLYLILDVYSRKIVGWNVRDTDHADHAAQLVRRTALGEGIAGFTCKPVLHGDNGATLKATTVLAMLYWLGVSPSDSRPRVSNDNAHAESLLRTAKIQYATPAQRHAGEDQAILARRHALYTTAPALHPARGSSTHNWTPIGAVALNPERVAVVTAQAARTANDHPEAA